MSVIYAKLLDTFAENITFKSIAEHTPAEFLDSENTLRSILANPNYPLVFFLEIEEKLLQVRELILAKKKIKGIKRVKQIALYNTYTELLYKNKTFLLGKVREMGLEKDLAINLEWVQELITPPPALTEKEEKNGR